MHQVYWGWVRTACGVGAAGGALSALLSYALGDSLVAESALLAQRCLAEGGPSVLLLLLWGVGGHATAVVTERRLAVGGLIALTVVAVAAVIAIVVDGGMWAVLARGRFADLLGLKAVCAVTWIGVGARRIYAA